MLYKYLVIIILFIGVSCKSKNSTTPATKKENTIAAQTADFTIAFGSCNKQDEENLLWDDIIKTKPDVWVWGGDNIYADTDNMQSLRKMYQQQNEIEGYSKLKRMVPVIGTWDDHDYGINDGGVEFDKKKESQQEFLDFLGVAKDDNRRTREGVYAAHNYTTGQGNIKIIVLDTRYFRTALTPDNKIRKRTKPNNYGEGTVLGDTQWKWLDMQLKTSDADFNLIISSIQFLSDQHGFETWGNFPHEVDKLKNMVTKSGAKGVIVLSGDRHISEFSKTKIQDLSYPLIDFTSSGLTHSYSAYKDEANPYRVGEVVSTKSFGLLNFDFSSKKVTMQMLGDDLKVLGELHQSY